MRRAHLEKSNALSPHVYADETSVEIAAETVSNYFDRTLLYDSDRRRIINKLMKILLLVTAVCLMGWAIWSAWQERQVLGASFLHSLKRGLELAVPGITLAFVATLSFLWKRGWELPAGLAALCIAADVHFLGSTDERITVAIATCGAGVFLYGLYLNIRYADDPAELAEFEKKLDMWAEQLLRGHINTEDLPSSTETKILILRSLPKLDRANVLRLQVRLGKDDKTRSTPLGAVAFEFRPDTLAVVEGAIDLKTKQLLYKHAREFAYEDVIELIWMTNARLGELPSMADAGAAAETEKKKLRLSLSARRDLWSRDLLELRVFGVRNISILLRNTEVKRGEWRSRKGFVEDRSKIQELWKEILMRQRHARREAKFSPRDKVPANFS